MAKYVGKYEAEDGRLFDSHAEAEQYEEDLRWTRALSTLIEHTKPFKSPDRQARLLDWLMETKGVIAEMVRWPRTKDTTVAEFINEKTETVDEELAEAVGQ